MKNRNTLLVIVLFVLISITFCSPLYNHFENWGQRDWDETFFWSGLARTTLLEHHQFPLWNPYSRGGMEFLGYPHSSFLSPMFLCVLLFGTHAGLKIEIIIYLFLGLLGMYTLSRFLGLSKTSSCLSTCVYNLSSVYVLHLAEGHLGWMAMGLLPWFFFAYLKSAQHRLWIIIAGAIFSLFLSCGSVDVTSITIVFLTGYSLFSCLKEKSLSPLIRTSIVFLCSGLLLAVKILPMLRFLSVYTKQFIETDGISFQRVGEMLLSRGQLSLYNLQIPELGMKYAWHEYGAYIGIIPLALAIIGLGSSFKKHWPLAGTALICLLLAMGNKSFIPLWDLLSQLPVYNSLRVPSRYILGVVFCAALFSGMGLEFFKKPVKTGMLQTKNMTIVKNIIFPCIVLFVAGDLFMVNSPILKKAFIFPPEHIERSDSFTQNKSNLGRPLNRWSDLYPSFLANKGTLNSSEIMLIQSHAVSVTDPRYKGEVYLSDGNGQAYINTFTPNEVTVEVQADEKDILVLNQNYYKGWKVIQKSRIFDTVSYNGLIAFAIMPDAKRVVFSYQPNGFKIGLGISLATLSCMIGFWIFSIKHKKS